MTKLIKILACMACQFLVAGIVVILRGGPADPVSWIGGVVFGILVGIQTRWWHMREEAR